MGCARNSRKRDCQQAWNGCQETDVTEHPVLLQPDPGHDGFFPHWQHHNHMGCGPPGAAVSDLLLATASNVLPSPRKATSAAAFYSAAEVYDTLAQLARLCQNARAM